MQEMIKLERQEADKDICESKGDVEKTKNKYENKLLVIKNRLQVLNTFVRNIIPIENMEPEDIVALIIKKLQSQRDQPDGPSRGRKHREANQYYATETQPLRSLSGSRDHRIATHNLKREPKAQTSVDPIVDSYLNLKRHASIKSSIMNEIR